MKIETSGSWFIIPGYLYYTLKEKKTFFGSILNSIKKTDYLRHGKRAA
jgi:hypothetical protein